jgi:DNA-binding MltR family transcriptional regulator
MSQKDADPIDAEVDVFVKEFVPAADRAAVLVAGAVLDDLLKQALIRRLLPNPTRTDDLFDGDAPLSTFSSRISLCFRLGLIDAGLARSLHLLRKVRNDFAHQVTNCDLASNPHSDRVRELCASIGDRAGFNGCRQQFESAGVAGVSADFRTAITLMFMRLLLARERAKVIEAQPVTLGPVQ